MIVPARAVVEADGRKFAFVVADGKATRVEVATGEARDADIAVTKGLKEGDVVVLSPPEGLKDGGRVATKAKG